MKNAIDHATAIADKLKPSIVDALLTDERAIELLPFRDRDEAIDLGLAKRGWPQETADKSWRTWLTPMGALVRDVILHRRHPPKNIIEHLNSGHYVSPKNAEEQKIIDQLWERGVLIIHLDPISYRLTDVRALDPVDNAAATHVALPPPTSNPLAGLQG